MNNSTHPRHADQEHELQRYLFDRPQLLLKMLDVAEAYQEGAGRPSTNAGAPSIKASTQTRLRARSEHERRKVVT